MRTAPNTSETEAAPSKPASATPSDIASASVPDTLATLHVNAETGLSRAEVDARRKAHGHNEVAEQKGHQGAEAARREKGQAMDLVEWGERRSPLGR